jgi:hypothetical protein
MKRLVYQDIKTKKNYCILFPATNTTIDRYGERMIIFKEDRGSNYLCSSETDFNNRFEMKEIEC